MKGFFFSPAAVTFLGRFFPFHSASLPDLGNLFLPQQSSSVWSGSPSDLWSLVSSPLILVDELRFRESLIHFSFLLYIRPGRVFFLFHFEEQFVVPSPSLSGLGQLPLSNAEILSPLCDQILFTDGTGNQLSPPLFSRAVFSFPLEIGEILGIPT